MNIDINHVVYTVFEPDRIPLLNRMINISYDNIMIQRRNNNIAFNLDFSYDDIMKYINIINTYDMVDNRVQNISLSDDMLNLMSYMGHDIDHRIYLYDEIHRYDLLFPTWKHNNINIDYMINTFSTFDVYIHCDGSQSHIYCRDNNERDRLLRTLPYKTANINGKIVDLVIHDDKYYIVHDRIFRDIYDVLLYVNDSDIFMSRFYEIRHHMSNVEYSINSRYRIVDLRKISPDYVISIMKGNNDFIFPNIVSYANIKSYMIKVYDMISKSTIVYDSDSDIFGGNSTSNQLYHEYEFTFIHLCDILGIQYDRDMIEYHMRTYNMPYIPTNQHNTMMNDEFIRDIKHFIEKYKKINCVMLHKAVYVSERLTFIQFLFMNHKFKEKDMLTLLMIKKLYNIHNISYSGN